MQGDDSRSLDERRVKHGLREVLDELIDHVRGISKRADLSEQEIDYAQERLQWLADEVWRLAMKRDSEESWSTSRHKT